MRFLYINPDETSQARATALGCGWMPQVPPEFQNIATAPCVILSGAGETIVLDPKGLSNSSVMKRAKPLLDAENTVVEQESPFQPVRDALKSSDPGDLHAALTSLIDVLDPPTENVN